MQSSPLFLELFSQQENFTLFLVGNRDHLVQWSLCWEVGAIFTAKCSKQIGKVKMWNIFQSTED